jgi:hypothetical protein
MVTSNPESALEPLMFENQPRQKVDCQTTERSYLACTFMLMPTLTLMQMVMVIVMPMPRDLSR